MIEIQVIDTNDSAKNFLFEKLADYCPFCKNHIKPVVLDAYVNCRNNEIIFQTKSWVIYKCPVNSCGNIFIGTYGYKIVHDGTRSHFCGPFSVYPIFPEETEFSEIIRKISPTFEQIYNQASFAEQQSMQLIAGPGYRKALEFLIKDYATTQSVDEDEKENIRKIKLGQVINSYIDDSRIQSIAKRAAWLGNDETHYLRKWEDKDLNSLKNLIKLTIRWIEMVELSKEAIEDMPE